MGDEKLNIFDALDKR